MDNTELSSVSVSDISQMLLKTNRPPTDEERAAVLESMVPVNAELKTLESQIFAAVAQVNVLQAQLKRAKNELLRLRKKEASVLGTLSDLRGTLSSFRNMPEDILREICIAFVAANVPEFSMSFAVYFPSYASLYTLMQISSGMERIVLGTPSFWASINIHIGSYVKEPHYREMVCEAKEWVERASGMALSISVNDVRSKRDANGEFDPANVLFDFLISHSSRWKSLRIGCSKLLTGITRIATLSAVDVPQLQSLSLYFDSDTSIFSNSKFLTAPALEHLTLAISLANVPAFDDTVNWARLTSLKFYYGTFQIGEIVDILQLTKCLSFCDLAVDYDQDLTVSDGDYPAEIHLPFLETFILNDEGRPSEHPGLFNLINAPNLRKFELWGQFLKASALVFFKRSPNMQELFLYQLFDEESLMDVTELLHHCPSLTILSLQRMKYIPSRSPDLLDVNRFLQTFVQEDKVVTCPRLEYFTFEGPIDMSVQTLRQFFEGKQRTITTPNSLRPWKTVTIDLRGIVDTDVQEQMLKVISEKRKEELFISVSSKELRYFEW